MASNRGGWVAGYTALLIPICMLGNHQDDLFFYFFRYPDGAWYQSHCHLIPHHAGMRTQNCYTIDQ